MATSLIIIPAWSSEVAMPNGNLNPEGMQTMPTIQPKTTYAVPSQKEGQSSTFEFDARMTPSPPQVGINTLGVEILRKNTAQPVTGLKVTAQVFMTSMDMGKEESKVYEIALGRYQLKMSFSMKGAWAVKLLLPDGIEKILNFEVGRSK